MTDTDLYHSILVPDMSQLIMRMLVADGFRCAAIMLACTCKQERANYAALGYKWPFLNARLSAARNGFVALFEHVFTPRPLDVDYNAETRRAVFAGPSVELAQWIIGPTLAHSPDEWGISTWPIFNALFYTHWRDNGRHESTLDTVLMFKKTASKLEMEELIIRARSHYKPGTIVYLFGSEIAAMKKAQDDAFAARPGMPFVSSYSGIINHTMVYILTKLN
jgi:hypothetical protein